MEHEVKLFMKKLRKISGFRNVKFVILYGSQALGKATPMSDYDFAVYYDGDKDERYNFRIKLGGQLPDTFDLHVFQDLPLYVRKEVLKGKVIYAQDLSFVYDIAYETIKDFEDFKKGYYDYIEMERIT